MDPVILYSPDGRQYPVDTPAEKVNLLSQGYSETQPQADAQAAQLATADGGQTDPASASVDPNAVDPTRPGDYNAQDVVAFVHEHPETAPTVREAEEGGKQRKTVLDAVTAVLADQDQTDPVAD